MKKHGLLIGIAVLLTAMVFTFAGCKNDTNSGTAKSIKITGIPSSNNGKEAFVGLIPSIEGDDTDPVALGAGTVTSSTFAAALLNEDESEWTGSGSYYIFLQIEDDGYITSAKHNFTDAVTEIAYGSFTSME